MNLLRRLTAMKGTEYSLCVVTKRLKRHKVQKPSLKTIITNEQGVVKKKQTYM